MGSEVMRVRTEVEEVAARIGGDASARRSVPVKAQAKPVSLEYGGERVGDKARLGFA